VPVCKALARIQPGEKKPTDSVRLLADEVLKPINAKQLQPESAVALAEYIDNFYLLWVKDNRRPSTYKDYKKDIYERHNLKTRFGKLQLRDTQIHHIQKLIMQISKEHPQIGHKTLLRFKSFLSGVFSMAQREGSLLTENPVRGVLVPGRPKKSKAPSYTIVEIVRLGESVGSHAVAFAAVNTAAWSGLRLSELRGLRWRDFDGKSLHVGRSVWRTHVGPTKTEDAEGSVPCIPLLIRILFDYKAKAKHTADSDYIFAGEKRGTPLNLPNLVRRVILPLIEGKCEWKGWHAFRRGLATNLAALNVQPAIAAAILRHADVRTTMPFYQVSSDQETREALAKIEAWVMATDSFC